MFSKETYINRRNKLKSDVKSGILLFLGNDESGMNYADNTYHFRQDSTFLYFFGSDYAGLNAIIDIDENREIIFGDELTIDHIVWMGSQPTIKEKSEHVGINETAPAAQLKTYLESVISKGRKIHYLPPYRPEHQVKLFELLDIIPSKANAGQSIDFVKAVVNQRNYKSQEEIVLLDDAVNITADMHLAAMRMARPGMKESEIAAAVQQVAIAAGGQLSFPVIATINGQTLHNHYHGNTLKSGDLFLLDCGAENSMHYAGDMSSTFPVDKTFTTRQKEIYQIALNAHEAAIDMLAPGVKFKDIHLKAGRTIAEGMKDMGFMKGDLDAAVQQGAHALFFQCGLGHMMGMDVHDMENLGEVYVGYNGEPKSTQFGLKSLRLGRELEENFVLTIEPGIYFIPELIDMWKAENRFSEFINYDKVEQYKDFGGCRNEEDFLITKDGARLLGKPIPKTIADVEAQR
ncbi:aminopeptidase P family protein [Ancylomarina euxinus]|uniref:Xaa-Pro aminopeptidase n=1 Tax=Ancylomarina euxinus TaxID=2283627 RepID=A0A425XX40_9BACT|nr:aminopeptidase P family protein [Ancylomarina euxinus]MCZ4696209.1 aminopeptidase P family protein [Ancylomarina euxinus]MUP16427.1 M24 family metallopeptidase [Ancylomarina euxinus]RRG19218.1 aminopeptidase P family protein [Ancylomarina euxinus]